MSVSFQYVNLHVHYDHFIYLFATSALDSCVVWLGLRNNTNQLSLTELILLSFTNPNKQVYVWLGEEIK